MKMSYKIALIVSVVVCILAFAVFKDKSQPEPTRAADIPNGTSQTPEQRKSLRVDSKGDGSLKSMVKANTTAPTNTADRSLAADARSRVLASLAKDAPQDAPQTDTQRPGTTGRSTANATSSDSPLGEGISRTIALARTEPGTPRTLTKIQAAAKASRPDPDSVPGPPQPSDASPRPRVKTLTIGGPRVAVTKSKNAKSQTDNPNTYVVQPGDTFSSIAIKLYQDELRWADISQANPMVEPTRLKVGQVLRLPGASEKLSDQEPVPPGPGAIQTYTIRPGNSLSTVAEKYYGDPTLWRIIYNFNRDKIGENPNAIQAGMTLKVPPKLSGAQ